MSHHAGYLRREVVGYQVTQSDCDLTQRAMSCEKASGVMGVVVGALSARWPASPLHVVALVVLGAAIFVLGLRVARVLGPEEIELVERTRLPGSRWLIAWCAAGR